MKKITPIKATLTETLNSYLDDSVNNWLQQALQTIASSQQTSEDLGLYSAMAKRKLGTALLQQAQPINTAYSPLNIERWSCADAGRLIMLITAIESQPDNTENIINSYYRMGDESEKMALVRGLILFAPADYLTDIALDVGRMNNLEVLASLTLDNPYPSSFYSEAEFNQMVLKALFLGLAIERVEGLAQRANPDLTRMGENYVIEREKASRSVPVDIWLAIAPYASDTGKQQMCNYIAHQETGHRYYCTLGLIQLLSQDQSLRSILQQRLAIEQQPMVLKLLQDTLQAN